MESLAILPLCYPSFVVIDIFFFQAEDGIRDYKVTGVQTCALPISYSLNLPGLPHPTEEKERERKEQEREAARKEIGRASCRVRAQGSPSFLVYEKRCYPRSKR